MTNIKPAKRLSRSRLTVLAGLVAVVGIVAVVFAHAAVGPSGVAMPVGDLNGWKQVFTDDFTTNVPLGGFPGSAYSGTWNAGYADGTPDTAGKSGSPSRYYPSKVLSVTGGALDMYLHTENGTPMGAAPMPMLSSAWPYNGQLYGRYAVRFRADSLKGFKTAWLLWPNSDVWADGEIDFPEGDLAGTIGAFSHCVGNPSSNCLAASSGQTFSAWHTAVTEWTPGKVAFYLDDRLIGSTTNSVPSKAMHYILQTESCLGGCPSSSTAGHLQLDWIAIYSYSPGTVAGPTPSVTATPSPTPIACPTPPNTTEIGCPGYVGFVPLNDSITGTGLNQFNFSGTWTTSAPSGAYMADNHYGNTAGSAYQVQFSGTQAKLYSQTGSDLGIVGVSIDGGAETMVDAYAATRAEQQLLYTSPVLSNSTHTLKVRVTGTKNAASTGTYAVADRVDYLSGSTTSTPAPGTPTPVPATPIPTPATATADLNHDGVVNIFDLSVLLSKWGTTGL